MAEAYAMVIKKLDIDILPSYSRKRFKPKLFSIDSVPIFGNAITIGKTTKCNEVVLLYSVDHKVIENKLDSLLRTVKAVECLLRKSIEPNNEGGKLSVSSIIVSSNGDKIMAFRIKQNPVTDEVVEKMKTYYQQSHGITAQPATTTLGSVNPTDTSKSASMGYFCLAK
jgi:hypothetical protein